MQQIKDVALLNPTPKVDIKQALRTEYIKCVQSPVYFMKNYSTIQHPTRGAIPFQLYQFQEQTVNEFINHSWNIILKSRQMGISTLCAGYILWFLIFQANKTVLIIANNQQVSMNMIRKIKLMYQALPSWLKQPLLTDNKQSLQFRNKSSVKAAGATPNAGVSEALSLLVWDQCAVVAQGLAYHIWNSAMPTLSCLHKDSKVTVRNKSTNIIQTINLGELNGRM